MYSIAQKVTCQALSCDLQLSCCKEWEKKVEFSSKSTTFPFISTSMRRQHESYGFDFFFDHKYFKRAIKLQITKETLSNHEQDKV